MRHFIFLLIGTLFGIVLFKSEAASWYRIFEMFHFKSFHMYGIIGSAVGLGVIAIQIIKRFKLKSFYGAEIVIEPKDKGLKRYIIGGITFGMGWALAGACPGPMFALLGSGFLPIVIVIIAATFGTYLYGLFKDKLPH